MSNKLYTVFLLSLAFLSCAEKDIKMQNTDYNLRGKVKQVNTISYSGDTTGDSSKKKKIALFDKVGNLTQETSYRSDGITADYKKVYTYNQNKNEGEMKMFKGDEVESLTIIKYDKNGYLQESIRTSLEDSKKDKTVYKNNNIGQLIEITPEDGDKQVLEYDNKGDLIQSTSFVLGIIKCQIKEYDKVGNWKKAFFLYKGEQYLMERQIEYYE